MYYLLQQNAFILSESSSSTEEETFQLLNGFMSRSVFFTFLSLCDWKSYIGKLIGASKVRVLKCHSNNNDKRVSKSHSNSLLQVYKGQQVL